MKKIFRSRIRFVAIPVLAIGCLFLVSFLVMALWNYALPELLSVRPINLWQSMALFFLCKILFGFGKGSPKGDGPPWGKKARFRRFVRLSEEEREGMKAHLRAKWCSWNDPEVTKQDLNDNENHEK